MFGVSFHKQTQEIEGKGNGDDWAAFALKLNNKGRLVAFSKERRKCFCDLDAFVVVCTRNSWYLLQFLLRRVVPGSVQPLFRSSKPHDEMRVAYEI